MPLVIPTAPTATLSLDALAFAVELKHINVCTTLHWILCLPSCCVSTEPLVDVLCRLPSARYVDCWGHSMALGSVGRFPSEEQQWIDLWESSLSAECVRSCFPDPVHVLVFFCPQQHTVSTQLYSYENILRQTAAYPVPSSKQWKNTLDQSVTCETKCLQCVGCLSLIKSQSDLEVGRCLPHGQLMAGAAEHRWLMTTALEAYCSVTLVSLVCLNHWIISSSTTKSPLQEIKVMFDRQRVSVYWLQANSK